MRTKKSIVSIIIIGIFCLIGIIFYKVEIKYLTPTSIPHDYQEILIGSNIDFNQLIQVDSNKATFIHFYNPLCPCSRFNIKHFLRLVEENNEKINFIVVAQDKDDKTLSTIQEQINDSYPLTIVLDKDAVIAQKLGVYSTPQAVILNKEKQLYYRGNYNKNRYCTNPNKFYAQQAIDSLLTNKSFPQFESYATKAYGCDLVTEKDFIDKLLLLN